MGTASRLATQLDREMLEVVRRVAIAASTTPDRNLPLKNGAQVADELGGRYLLRYLLPHQVGRYLRRSGDRHWVTPTPYAPEETVTWLALPVPTQPRPYVMLLNPAGIPEICGPRWIRFGGGIEYLLPRGFPPEALAFPWELEVR